MATKQIDFKFRFQRTTKGMKFPNRKKKNTSIKDVVGKRFGRLIVLGYHHTKNSNRYWECVCDCGKIKITTTVRLSNGQCKSCGCLCRETTGNNFRTHGRAGCQEHKLWKDAKKRSIEFELEFNITIDDIIIPENCPILGIKLFNTPKKPTNNTPSLDRINPVLGYIKGNIRVISVRANRLKQDSTIEELERIIMYMKNEI